MSRWIDADALKANINTAFWSEIEKIIDSAPSLDLVRCEECIHFTKLSDGWGRCNAHDRIAQTIDFCSWAERKESE